MISKRLASAVLFGTILWLTVGCSSVPPAPPHAAPHTAAGEDDDDGWLFDRLTGRTPTDDSRVVQASASEPVGNSYSDRRGYDELVYDDEEEDDSGFDWEDLDPENVYNSAKAALGYGPDEGKARAYFAEGEGLFAEGERLLRQQQKSEATAKFESAAGKFKSAGKRWPDTPLEEDALFKQAESHFFADEYPKAQDSYDNLLKKYDNSQYLGTAAERLFAIGRYWEGLHEKDPSWPVTPNVTDGTRPTFDTLGNALKAYETIRMKDPSGPLADESIMAAAIVHYKKNQFEDAAYYFDLLRKNYTDSKYQKQAHLLGVESKLHIYQGAPYDDTPLVEADEIASQAAIQFGRELGEDFTKLTKIRNDIIEEVAERDYQMGQFYEKKKYYRSARFYYRAILDTHPHTAAAEKARTRLMEIRNEPDVPVNHLQWLTDPFGSKG